MDMKYCVVFVGLLNTKEAFTEKMSNYGVTPPIIDRILENAPVILKTGMLIGKAKQYAQTVQSAGGKVTIRPHVHAKKQKTPFKIEPLESFTMCPDCGYKQLKAKCCVKCGYLY